MGNACIPAFPVVGSVIDLRETTMTATKTTASWRREAQEAETLLDWNRAAKAWQQAIDAYPSPVGRLADHDLAQMQRRLADCRRELATTR